LTHNSQETALSDLRGARLYSIGPLVATLDEFVGEAELDGLMMGLSGIRQAAAQVTGVMGQGVDPRRVADSAKIPHGSLPVLDAVATRIAKIFGLPVSHCESPELISYGVGGIFKRHFDAALGGAMYKAPADAAEHSQRVLTAILYLNDEFAGGETVFPRLDLTLRPKAGRLALWQNTKAGDVAVHPLSMHEGRPVLSGQKQIVSFWFRNKPVQ